MSSGEGFEGHFCAPDRLRDDESNDALKEHP